MTDFAPRLVTANPLLSPKQVSQVYPVTSGQQSDLRSLRFGNQDNSPSDSGLIQQIKAGLVWTLKKIMTGLDNLIDYLDPPKNGIKVLYETCFLRLVKKLQTSLGHRWDYVQRTNATSGVVVVPIHDNKVLLIEQIRPPFEDGKQDPCIIEWPAGLVGDKADKAGKGLTENDSGTPETEEDIKQSGSRELEEETGYRASELRYLGKGTSSAGLTDEVTHFVLARNLTKVSDKLGVGSEQITKLHWIPLDEVDTWLYDQNVNKGKLFANSVQAGLNLLRRSPVAQ